MSDNVMTENERNKRSLILNSFKSLLKDVNSGKYGSVDDPLAFITLSLFQEASGISRRQVRNYFGNFTNLKQIFYNSKTLVASSKRTIPSKETEITSTIFSDKNNTDNKETLVTDFKQKYVYNPENDKYIFLMHNSIGKNIVLSGDTVRAIVKVYSNFSGETKTINQIAVDFKLHRKIVVELLKSLGITHDSSPFTDEEFSEKDEEELISEALTEKKFAFKQRLMKEDWKDTIKAASNWHRFENALLNPFAQFVENFRPSVTPITFETSKINVPPSDNVLVLGISDVHYGTKATQEYLYHGEEYNIDIAEKIMQNYKKEALLDISENNYNTNLHILFLGDIIDSINGYTSKGTQLISDVTGFVQFERAFNSLLDYLVSVSASFGKITVKCVTGNHDEFADWCLYNMLAKYLSSDVRFDFEIVANSRWLPFTIYDSLFVIEHGYSAEYKSKLPINNGPAKEAFIQNVFLRKPELLAKSKSRYYISADMHTVNYSEYGSFEYIRFSSPVKGSQFADNSNLSGRPRQNGLVVTKGKGVTNFKQFYV